MTGSEEYSESPDGDGADTTDFSERIQSAKETAADIPTGPGSAFRISDFGFEDGGLAVVAVKEAFRDTWGDVAVRTTNEYGDEPTYAFEGKNPIYLSHVPDPDPDIHGPETMGLRYNYQFIRDIDQNNKIRVLSWDETRFTDVEEVVYP